MDLCLVVGRGANTPRFEGIGAVPVSLDVGGVSAPTGNVCVSSEGARAGQWVVACACVRASVCVCFFDLASFLPFSMLLPPFSFASPSLHLNTPAPTGQRNPLPPSA